MRKKPELDAELGLISKKQKAAATFEAKANVLEDQDKMFFLDDLGSVSPTERTCTNKYSLSRQIVLKI